MSVNRFISMRVRIDFFLQHTGWSIRVLLYLARDFVCPAGL